MISKIPSSGAPDKPLPSDEVDLLSYNSMLYKICQEEDIDFQLLSLNWIKRLEKNQQTHYIIGYKFDLNSYSAGTIADDKYATYSVLRHYHIPAVEHEIIYRFTNQSNYAQGHNSYADVLRYFQQHHNHIVVKPNCGTGGRNVHQVSDLDTLPLAITDVLTATDTACLCPFYQVKHEYRVVLLNNKVRLAYMKTLNDPTNWKFNLQQGSTAEPIPDSLLPNITNLAEQAANAIGLNFCSVDIIETNDDDLLVMEVNSGVMIVKYLDQHPDQYKLVEDIYRDAIKVMFK